MKKCPVSDICGACQYQGTPYERQLELKQQKTVRLLGEFGRVEPIIGMSDPYYYRNKVQVTYGRDNNNRIIYGNYVASTHFIVQIKDCQIANRKANEIFEEIRKMLGAFKLSVFDEFSMQGFLRHVLVRTSADEEEVMVVLVTGSHVFPKKQGFISELIKRCPYITTIVQNVNGRRTSMVLGERDIVLYGRGYIEDELLGNVYRISPQSFYQINHSQTEKLYRTAIEFAGMDKDDIVLDTYCGIGTIGISMASHCQQVLGVEINKAAVRDAVNNAKMNNIRNTSFECDDAGRYMNRLAYNKQKADIVIMDPPRTGSDEKFMNAVCKLKPKKIVYISCNPVTQKRDLKYFIRRGYVVGRIRPVDMFPFTDHVECIALICRK